eukprot:8150316-Alexandrium_andersonii.AAC.1
MGMQLDMCGCIVLMSSPLPDLGPGKSPQQRGPPTSKRRRWVVGGAAHSGMQRQHRRENNQFNRLWGGSLRSQGCLCCVP